MRLLRACHLLPFVVACGGTIDRDAGVDGSADSGVDVGTRDAIVVVDSSNGCSKATVMLGTGTGNCTAGIHWTCNGTGYGFTGSCTMSNLIGSCEVDGIPPSTMVNAPICTCSNPTGMALLAAKECGFPAPAP